nr:acetoacetate decarboxylase family protein [Amycolatopsis keratiniphila]
MRADGQYATFAIKAIPDYTGGLRVCDLIRTQITDIDIKWAWQGPARLHLAEHVMAPLADLPVHQVISASHILTDLTLAPATPVHDYLDQAKRP